jgi:hypothetical protein
MYLAMNDVTSMLYVSLFRQFETLLFYVIASRIEALVSRHKFLKACVEKVYRLLIFWNPSGTGFQSQSGAQFSETHSEKIRPDP